MDWRYRKYYTVSFSPEANEMRMGLLKLIPEIKFSPYKRLDKQNDEIEIRPRYYQALISVPFEWDAELEEQLRDASRRDFFGCRWQEIRRMK